MDFHEWKKITHEKIDFYGEEGKQMKVSFEWEKGKMMALQQYFG